MYQTLSTTDAIHALTSDPYGHWSYEGARALIAYLVAQEHFEGAPVEFDRVALRCAWAEYPTALDAALDYGHDPGNDHDALEWLCDQTTVVTFDGGLLVAAF